MNKFDKVVSNIMESIKLVKEAYSEYDYELNLGDDNVEGMLVREVLPNDPAGDDVLCITASITMPYSLDSGEAQSWDSPGSDPSAEIEDVVFHNVQLYRYSQASDEYTEVTPEMFGQEVYNTVLAKLKAQAEEVAIKDAYDNIDVRGYE
jgi:hypothetical protein